ncbi:MAG: metal ABC transporter substrate-binding protein [Pseudomonadota bacterium]
MLPYKTNSTGIRFFGFLFIFGLLSGVSFSADKIPGPEKPVIVASTTMIASLVRDLAGDHFEILTLLPPNSCPGHFDLKPADVLRIRDAVLIIGHQYQRDLQKALRSQVREKGRWLILADRYTPTIPEDYLRMGRFLLDDLKRRFPAQEASFRKQWLQVEADILQTAEAFKKEFQKKKPLSSPLIVAFHQKDFVRSWGFDPVGVFDSPGGESMPQLKALIQKGEKTGVLAIIGNLQTGGKEAEVIAEKLKVPLIFLSNFPGGEAGTSTYKELLRSNCLKMLKVLG